jgi:hypothetical protein
MGIVRRITLRGASVAALVDDIESWAIAEEFLLDGFRYSRFIDTEIQDGTKAWILHRSPTESADRIRWLDFQREQGFKPQPWEQLIKVLRETGYQDGAKSVAIAKQKRTYKSKAAAQALHRIYGVLCGYGYQPTRLIAWAIAVAVVWAVLFWAAGWLGVMTPTDWKLVASIHHPDCRPESSGNWTTCQELHQRGYPSFDPIAYSFDLILPVIATQQTKDWAPATTLRCDRVIYGLCEQAAAKDAAPRYWLLGLIFWLLARFETLAGWAFGLTFVAIVSGLIKKD